MERRKRTAIVGLLALAAACSGDAEPRQADAKEPPFGAPVRIVSQRLEPGWHHGSIGAVGDCVVVMIPEPPVDPVRLHPVDFADIAEVEMGDSAGSRWTPVPVEPLRAKHGGCL